LVAAGEDFGVEGAVVEVVAAFLRMRAQGMLARARVLAGLGVMAEAGRRMAVGRVMAVDLGGHDDRWRMNCRLCFDWRFRNWSNFLQADLVFSR